MKQKFIFFALLIGLFLISSCSRILCDKWVVWWDRNTPDRGCRQWEALSRIDRSHLVFVCTGPLVIKTRKEKKRRRLICRSPKCKLIVGKKIWNNAAVVCLGLSLPLKLLVGLKWSEHLPPYMKCFPIAAVQSECLIRLSCRINLRVEHSKRACRMQIASLKCALYCKGKTEIHTVFIEKPCEEIRFDCSTTACISC